MNAIAAISRQAAASDTPAAATPETDRLGMDKDMFLHLLVTQMKNQNPLEPMEDKEFIAQLATMNSAEQLTAMNKQITSLMTQQASTQGFNMAGSIVTVIGDDGTESTGRVDRVLFNQGTPQLEVNGKLYYLGQVKEVKADSAGVTTGTEAPPA